MNTGNFELKNNRPSLRDEFCVWSTVGNGEAEYEISEEYILPDYLPDIKKILFVKSDVSENDEFIGDGRAEFGGEAVFNIIYSGDSGSPRCVSRAFNYLNGIELESIYDESIIDSRSHIKNRTVRALSPRKILIKAKVVTRINVRNKVCVSPRLTGGSGMEDEFTLERKVNYIDCVNFARITEKDIRMSEDIEYRGKYPISELICAVADAVTGDCKYDSGKMTLRGNVRLGFLVAAGDGEQNIEWVCKLIPFEQVLETDGLPDKAECMAELCVTAFEYGVANDSYGESRILEADLCCMAKITVCSNASAMFTDDVYSTAFEYKNTYREITTEKITACFSGNFSADGSAELSLRDGSGPVSAVMSDGDCELTFNGIDNGKLKFSGECTVRVILYNGGEGYNTSDITFPIKYEAPSSGASKCKVIADSNIIDIRTSVDGNKLSANVEIGVNCMVLENITAATVSQIDLDKSSPLKGETDKALLLYYPEKGEGMWDVAKRYSIPESLLVSANRDRISEKGMPAVLVIPQNKK